MSTAALHFDPGFNHFHMGGRTSFAWPDIVLESTHHGLMGQEIGSYNPSEASLSPPSHSRSLASSPHRMSAEQRELKRQRDQARRDSKLAARLSRAGSLSSQGGQYDVVASPPSSNGDYSATTGLHNMPIYTTAPAELSLLTEPTTLAPQMVALPPYSSPLPSASSLPLHSPPLPSSSSTIFPSPYQPPSYLDYSYPPSTASSMSSHYGPISHDPIMYSMPPVMAPTAPHVQHSHHHDAAGHVRVVQSRPKPQCWEHGCNGRQFSTFSNLLRHQREKSGQAAKASCPDCGAEFTRTTARNGHLLHQKCKQKRPRQPSTSSN